MHHKFKIILLLSILFLISIKTFAGTQEKLPDSLIFLPDNNNAIIVEKSSQQVMIYSSAGGEIFKRLQIQCSTGEVSGNKEKSGDKKTPEGVYFIKDRYEDKDLTPIYGKKAFPIDYPNFMDKLDKRTGNSIWLHGTNKVLKAMDSNGCVAMEDKNILKLSEFVALNNTPVIIVDKLSMTDKDRLDIQNKIIQEWFKGFVNAINKGSYHDYLSFYDDSYLPDILWWKKWYDIRSETKKNTGEFSITISNKGIYKQNNIYVIIFNMGVKLLKQNIDFGVRKLFVVKTDNYYKIVGDVYQDYNKKVYGNNSPLVIAAGTLAQKIEQRPDIRDTVRNWLKAWTGKDMDKYASYYSKEFLADGLNKKEWVERKRNLAKRYGYIKVVTSDFKVKKAKNQIVVQFLQGYKSSGFSATGTKTLMFVDEDKQWKIYRESWKKK